MYRMMIVDDEERIVNSIYDLMEERFDFELHRCYSAVQAVGLLNKMRFDIIISDVSMPQMNGLELLAFAKDRWPKCHFLMLTAYNSFDYAYQTLKYDRVDYLLKVESYDEICSVVAQKREKLEEERLEEEKQLRVDHHIHHLCDTMERYFLKRIIVQGYPLPEQADLDDIGIKLLINQPVLLVIGAINTKEPFDRNIVATNIEEYVSRQLSQYDMQCSCYLSTSYLVFAIQKKEDSERPLDTMLVYAHTVFDTLPQTVEVQTGYQLTVLCADDFVPFHDVHMLYQRGIARLEQLQNQSGMVLLSAGNASQPQQINFTFPSIDEMNLLWEMIKCSNIQGFSELLHNGLKDLSQQGDAQTLLPSASLYAIKFLLLETAKLYAPHYAEKAPFHDVLHMKGYTRGQTWIEDVVKTIEAILAERSISQKKTGVWLVECINQYVEQNYAQDITLTDLAEIMHYSPSYLSRFYKGSTGVNIMSYVYTVRISHAKVLLSRTNIKVSEVAVQTGFCSSKYFNRVFKKSVGVSAIQYRQENTEIMRMDL